MAGLQFVGGELFQHFWGDGQLVQAGSGDAGDTIEVVVTASNSAGTGQASSAATAVVTVPVQPPVNTSLPTIGGQTVVGDTLTAANGLVV